MDVSIVIPVYGCRAALPELHRRLTETLKTSFIYEIILVEDGCPQHSWEEIKKICEKDSCVKGIKLTRNFGQHRAIRAGLEKARGEWIVIMDCDLQDRPEDIPILLSKAQEGYDAVIKRRRKRTENLLNLFLSRLFYWVYNYFTEGIFDSELSNFSVHSKRLVGQLVKVSEQNCDFIILVKWLGYKTAEVELDDDTRYAGKSSYSFIRKVNMAVELITQNSNRPLYFAIKLGFCISMLSFLFIIYVVVMRIVVNDYDAGWSSIIASIYLMGGMILSALGVVGVYIGNIFNESKNRPLYAVQEVLNDD